MKKYKLLVCIIAVHAVEANRLSKIYVHHAPVEQTICNIPQLELTKAALHFSEQPVMHQLAHNNQGLNGWKHETYFFTMSDIEPTCKSKLTDLQKKTDYYQMACTEVSEPRNGLRLEICYDPQHIACIYESYDAITSDKGVVFRLINKKLLDEMSRAEKPLLQTVYNKANRIVIDCGHGGTDPGAVGINKVAEKDVTMQVGHKLAHLLRKQGCEVIMTRDADVFIPLTMRTQIINMHRPDAFISIHANSSPRQTVQGIETYCLSADLFSSDERSDSTSTEFRHLIKGQYATSKRLAESVHAKIFSHVSSVEVCNRKVRNSVTQVLLGANFPGILVEVGFLTHPEEAVRLAQSDYQEKLASGMCQGLLAFLNV